jgi:two-component system, response regulator RegA
MTMRALDHTQDAGWRAEYAERHGLDPVRHDPRGERLPDELPRTGRSLLLIESSPATRGQLQRALTANGFTVTCLAGMSAALHPGTRAEFHCAVIELRFGRGNDLDLVRQLRRRYPLMRIVVVTDHDSFAAVILALRAGAADYLPKPLGEDELVDALLGRAPTLPPVPETPLGLQRVYWEHLQRIFAQCGYNISEAARRLRMHRRTLQRILGKRAPRPRACNWDETTADLRLGAVARSCGRALRSRTHRQA